jgi:hypothetical protein
MAGTFTTPVMAKGGTLTLTIRVQVSSLALSGDKQVVSITANSVGASGAIDVVRGITAV